MSRDEAEEQYARSRKEYENAERRRAELENRIDNCRQEKRHAAAQIRSAKSEKTNFEKRLRGIENIIKMLDGSGGFLSVNAPESIDKANSALQSTNDRYQRCIRLEGGASAADMEERFRAESVDGDLRSAEALRLYRAERDRLERAIADLNSEIDSCYAKIDALTRSINSGLAEQSAVRKTMISSTFEMVRCKSVLNW